MDDGDVGRIATALGQNLALSMRPLIEEAVEEALPSPSSTAVRQAPKGTRWATVKNVEHPTPKLALLQLEVDGDFPFKAGQFTMVHGQARDGPRRRAYSISSPPSWLPRLDLAVSLVNDEGESGWLCTRKPGDRIQIEPAKGHFTFRNPERPTVFLATGTGIAPFRSMLYDQWDQGREPDVWLFVGARLVVELPYHEELKALHEKHATFDYVPVVSRPGRPWEGLTGHIQAPFLARFEGRTDFDAYLCGSPAMVKDTHDLLLRRGLPKAQVFQERFT